MCLWVIRLAWRNIIFLSFFRDWYFKIPFRSDLFFSSFSFFPPVRCYLKRIPFFISFFVPVCIVMIWNSVVYILVARQMHRLRKRQTKFNQTFSLTDQLRASFSLTFLLGLTWLFAFFAFGELNLTFTYLFAITNTLQGFVVFLLHCVFKREIRRQWQALCCPCIPLLKEGDDGTYSRSKTGQLLNGAFIYRQIFSIDVSNWNK